MTKLVGGDLQGLLTGKLPVIVPVKLRKLLQSPRGQLKIKQLWVVRTPVEAQYRWLMRVASSGEIDSQMAKLGYTSLFHLFVVMMLEDGSVWRVEKNQRIAFYPGNIESPDKIGPFPVGIPTLRKFFDNAAQYTKGWSELAGYSPESNSCQTFVESLLLPNNLYTMERRKFIRQNLKAVLRTSPLTSALISKVISAVGTLEFIADETVDDVRNIAGTIAEIRGSRFG